MRVGGISPLSAIETKRPYAFFDIDYFSTDAGGT